MNRGIVPPAQSVVFSFGEPACLSATKLGAPLAARAKDNGSVFQGIVISLTLSACRKDGGNGCIGEIARLGQRQVVNCHDHDLCTGHPTAQSP